MWDPMELVVGIVLKRCGVERLHYMCHIENAPTVLLLGILSRSRALTMPHRDVSLSSVQRQRETTLALSGRRLHEYACLYFATHTPMQYVLTCGTRGCPAIIHEEQLVFIDVDAVKTFQRKGVIFTDGNAASNETNFYTRIEDIIQLDWDIIRTQDCYTREYKRKKAAEVLVPDRVPAELIKRVVVASKEARRALRQSIKNLRSSFSERSPDVDVSHLARCRIFVEPSYYYHSYD